MFLDPVGVASGGNCLLTATASDNMLHLLDLRTGQVAVDLRACVGAAGLVKTVCVSGGSGHTATVGHASGYLSQVS